MVKGGEAVLPVRLKQTESLMTRDGIRLDADVYYPDAEGTFPVLLMRQPYGRAIASTVTYAHPQWYAAQGYIVVIQDVRGRGTSEGEFDLFAHEINDGVDTVNWAAQLPGSTGDVGMYGFSYQGMTQLFAAAGQPPALKTICPAMVAYDLYADWAYEGDAFCLFGNQAWALQLAAETARRQGNEDAYQSLYAEAHRLAIADPINATCELLNQYAPDSFYHDWLNRSNPTDPYWIARSPKTYIGQIDLPMLHIGGWFDTHLRGTIKLYQALSDRSSHPQHLWVGPWAHIPWGRKVGAIDFGANANSPIDQVQIRWFDHILKDIDSGLLDQPPVHLFEMGCNQWRSFSKFPSD
ncbi:MAG: CocE/NonD family hydrolase, partial [Synechococcales cyanobacterium T60_A2020_003]|nr:CocE/NonD family hydrolase [Synechococcales cyanobacterium T60_A2020_003]